MPAGGSLRPASHETVDQRLHYVKQDGQAVFKFAVRNTEEACRRLLERNERHRRRHRPASCRTRPTAASSSSAAEKLGVARGEGRHQHRAVRQHDRGDDSAGAQRRRRRQAAQEGRPAADGVGRRRLHGRRRAAALGTEGVGSKLPEFRAQQAGPADRASDSRSRRRPVDNVIVKVERPRRPADQPPQAVLARAEDHQGRPDPVLRRRRAGAAAAHPDRAMVMRRYPERRGRRRRSS